MPNQQNLNSTSSQESSGKTVVKAMWDGATTGLSVLIFALAILIVGVPAVVGGMPLIVLSGSMQPVYKPGDLVVVRSIGASEIRIGDVITYQLRSGEPELITHRVIERSNTIGGEVTFITKGDANPSADEDPVREVQVRGTVWYRIPLLGWVNNIITGQTREWLIPAVAAALIAYAFWNFGKELHNRRKS